MNRFRLGSLAGIAAAVVLLAPPASAQIPDLTSLNGTYNVRYLGVNTDPADSPVSFSGTITFDGKGAFTVAGSGADASATSKTLAFKTSGQYSVLPSGSIEITNPFDIANGTTFATADTILYGGISSGSFLASSTDTFYCDLLVGISAASSASAATLNGNYTVAHLEFLNADFAQTRNSLFKMTADGKGALGNVTINGTAQSLSDKATTQTSTAATYTVTANGAGTMVFPAPAGISAANTLLSGNKVMYVSNDGNFFVAGGTSTYDIIIGTKSLTTAPSKSGNYFTGQLENLAEGTSGDGVYAAVGVANELTSGDLELFHQRVQPDCCFAYDFTISGAFALGADGTVSYSDSAYALGGNGNVILGTGLAGNYQIFLYLKSIPISGTGVFLNPQGVVNAASNLPFSAQVSPGEVLTLYGSNLAGSTATTPGLPFPTTLAGVSVSIAFNTSSGTTTVQAPLYFVSPTQISLVVPYTIPTNGTVLNFTVNNGGTNSNTARVYSGQSSPGIFTVPSGGIGDGAILHADFTLVTAASPAKAGETVQVFLTGLGTVNSTIAAGAAAPTNPLATTTSTPLVFVDDAQGANSLQAKVVYSGLAPNLGGLYQLNITIPSGLGAGDGTLEILTLGSSGDLDSYSIQANIPLAGK